MRRAKGGLPPPTPPLITLARPAKLPTLLELHFSTLLVAIIGLFTLAHLSESGGGPLPLSPDIAARCGFNSLLQRKPTVINKPCGRTNRSQACLAEYNWFQVGEQLIPNPIIEWRTSLISLTSYSTASEPGLALQFEHLVNRPLLSTFSTVNVMACLWQLMPV